MVQEILSKDQFTQIVNQTDQAVLIDVFADYCGPCKAIAPYIERLVAIYPSIQFYKLDYEKLTPLCQELSVRSLPTFLLYNQGLEIGRSLGADKTKLMNLILSLTN
jgi:thioredoxin 1